jgi:RNA polymerase sigma-70 factor (ECF subfamily)
MVSVLFFERSPDQEPRYPSDEIGTWDANADPDRLMSELTQHYWERLRLFAVRRIRNAGLAEEVAQDTIRVAWQAVRDGHVRDRQALPAFLFQTAKNICLHRFRSADRESRALAAFVGDGKEPSTDTDALTDLITRENAQRVRSALDSLPAAERELLRACFVDEEDSEAIARRLGTTPGALRVRKHRALRKLAELLGRHGRNAEPGTGT